MLKSFMLYFMEKEGDSLLTKSLKIYISGGEILLEVGAGNCNLLKKIVKKFKVYGYGIDPFLYQRQENEVKCFPLSGEEISKLNKKFDIIYLIRSFHHIKNREKFLKEAGKGLKKDGKLIIVDWKKGTETGIDEYYYDILEVSELLKKENFKIVEEKELKWNFLVVAKKI